MYFEEPRTEKHPLRLALALTAALLVHGAAAAALLHGGIDNRIAAAVPVKVVADLGTLPEVKVVACRAA